MFELWGNPDSVRWAVVPLPILALAPLGVALLLWLLKGRVPWQDRFVHPLHALPLLLAAIDLASVFQMGARGVLVTPGPNILRAGSLDVSLLWVMEAQTSLHVAAITALGWAAATCSKPNPWVLACGQTLLVTALLTDSAVGLLLLVAAAIATLTAYGRWSPGATLLSSGGWLMLLIAFLLNAWTLGGGWVGGEYLPDYGPRFVALHEGAGPKKDDAVAGSGAQGLLTMLSHPGAQIRRGVDVAARGGALDLPSSPFVAEPVAAGRTSLLVDAGGGIVVGGTGDEISVLEHVSIPRGETTEILALGPTDSIREARLQASVVDEQNHPLNLQIARHQLPGGWGAHSVMSGFLAAGAVALVWGMLLALTAAGSLWAPAMFATAAGAWMARAASSFSWDSGGSAIALTVLTVGWLFCALVAMRRREPAIHAAWILSGAAIASGFSAAPSNVAHILSLLVPMLLLGAAQRLRWLPSRIPTWCVVATIAVSAWRVAGALDGSPRVLVLLVLALLLAVSVTCARELERAWGASQGPLLGEPWWEPPLHAISVQASGRGIALRRILDEISSVMLRVDDQVTLSRRASGPMRRLAAALWLVGVLLSSAWIFGQRP